MSFLRYIYSSFTLAASVLLAVPFALSRRGRKRILERYGVWRLSSAEPLLWFHAASVGEIRALLPVVRQVKAKSSLKVLVTASSVEGLARAEGIADYTKLLPFDNALWIQKAVSRLKISTFIFSETEIWPALLEYLLSRHVNVCMVNATISDYSWTWFRSGRFYLCTLFSRFALFLAVDRRSAERLIELGAPAEKVQVCGNSKFDLEPSIRSNAEAQALKRSFFDLDAPVLVLGSLRPGEEQIWFEAISSSLEAGLNFLVIVAPRHPEKSEHFAKALSERQIQFKRRSEYSTQTGARSEHVVLLNTLGELEACYSFADVAFIGGTLQDWGGHNPLEAAAYGAYIALGPFRSKVEGVAQALFECGAGRELMDIEQARELIEEMCRDMNVLDIIEGLEKPDEKSEE